MTGATVGQPHDRRFELTDFATMLQRPGVDESSRGIVQVVSLPSVRVAVPPLRVGLPFVEHWTIRESPGYAYWAPDHYDSIAPAAYAIDAATVHSPAGIVLFEDRVFAESLAHTQPAVHRYRPDADAVWIDTARLQQLAGTYVSALAGANANYFHNVVDCVGRLSALPPGMLRAADGVLVPAGCAPIARMLELLDPGLKRREVAPDETLLVERLIQPGAMYGPIDFHPCLPALLDQIAAAVPARRQKRGRRLYIDRRDARFRRLLNENELLEGLSAFG